MNLEELRLYKKHLKLERYLYFALAFVMTLGLNGPSRKKDTKQDSASNVSIECSVNNLNSSLDMSGASLGINQIDLAKSVLTSKTTLMQEALGLETKVESLKGNSVELTYEEKMHAICERDGYTYEELDMVLAGCVAESCEDGNNYDECYHVASAFYNRTHDVDYVNDISNIFGENTGYSIYYQFIAPNQFSVYSSGSYKEYLGRIDLKGYQAAIDMFYSCEASHDYLNFNFIPPKSGNYEQLVPNGNYYCRHQKPENVIDNEQVNELVLTLSKD